MTPRLPATLPNLDDHVFETIARWFDKFIRQTSPADSHRIRQGLIKKRVREGWPLRRVIEMTSDKNWAIDADAALRDLAEEINEQGELPKLLTAYLISYPKPSRGRGRRDGDNALFDQCIAVCVGYARERWHGVILLTRDPEATDGPSICSIMAAVCKSRGRRIDEKRVKQIYDRYVEFLPRHQSWLSAA
jgi:hypothetical protein